MKVLSLPHKYDTMGKRVTTLSKKTKRKVQSATSTNKKRSRQDTIALEDVLEFVLGNGWLHWSEIMPLSGVNKTYQRVIKSSPVTKTALERLLLAFDRMVTTNEHEYCGKLYAPLSRRRCQCNDRTGDYEDPSQNPYADVDPRYSEEYDDWPLEMKCSEMITFVTMLATNFRAHFDFDDLSRRTAAGLSVPSRWSFGRGNEVVDEILHDCPRRSTLMLNLAALSFGQNPVRDDSYFNDALLGTGPIDNSGSNFGQTVCGIMHSMGPFRDEELVCFIRECLYPSLNSQNILGLPLVRKVWICAPLFDSIPLSAANGEACLPIALELVDEEWLEEYRLHEELNETEY
jgi:hypothetical protein